MLRLYIFPYIEYTMVNKPTRQKDGKYHIKGKTFKHLRGSRREVWNGTAFQTEGRLKKEDFVMNKHQRIVSRKKHMKGKQEHKSKSRLFKEYTAKKGKFGAIKRGGSTRKK